MDFANLFYLLLSVILPLGTVVAGYLAFRHSYRRFVLELHKSAIEAQTAEINALKDQNKEQEKEITRLNQLVDIIVKAMDNQGWKISIDGSLVSIRDTSGGTHTSRIVS
jgi:hypothetical protein